MRLYVFRHAWAEPLSPDFMDDDARPLTAEGRARFADFVARLAAGGVAPNRIAHSPLVRTRETAELLAGDGGAELTALEALVPDIDVAALLAWTGVAGGGDTAWVGHAPDVGEAVSLLSGLSRPLDFSAGAVAAIDFSAAPTAGAGQLRWFADARLFGI